MLEPSVKGAGDLAAGPSEFYIGVFEFAGNSNNHNKDKKDNKADSTEANGSEADAAKYRAARAGGRPLRRVRLGRARRVQGGLRRGRVRELGGLRRDGARRGERGGSPPM
ncbi:unnamed protein product [Prorocentrum cordatum]|uniref:Uncharacterized protein n=1 Tax=Prorocentrum cordatum TaxID=2364126 RepID=A0ABN9TJX4_9DINO|nr:unnamed protein product [Polarella glacialis]